MAYEEGIQLPMSQVGRTLFPTSEKYGANLNGPLEPKDTTLLLNNKENKSESPV